MSEKKAKSKDDAVLDMLWNIRIELSVANAIAMYMAEADPNVSNEQFSSLSESIAKRREMLR